jgi:hypothetical protein
MGGWGGINKSVPFITLSDKKSGKAGKPFRFKFIAIAITTLRQQN